MQLFDHKRTDFMPYGYTCEQWMPGCMKRPDRHNEIELNLLIEGEIVYLFGGRIVPIRAGHLGVFWASMPHQIISCTGNTPYYVVTIPLPWFLACRLPSNTVELLLNGEVLIESLGQRSRLDQEIFLQWMEDLRQPEVTQKRIALLEIEARLHRLSLKSDPRQPISRQRTEPFVLGAAGAEKVEQMAYFIAQNYTDQLSVERIAQYVNLHPNYAMDLFRRTFGTTMIDYINDHRVMHAQRLLVTSDDSILEVSLRSGFNSLSRFNVVFKIRSGCTPSTYRRNHRLPFLQDTTI